MNWTCFDGNWHKSVIIYINHFYLHTVFNLISGENICISWNNILCTIESWTSTKIIDNMICTKWTRWMKCNLNLKHQTSNIKQVILRKLVNFFIGPDIRGSNVISYSPSIGKLSLESTACDEHLERQVLESLLWKEKIEREEIRFINY